MKRTSTWRPTGELLLVVVIGAVLALMKEWWIAVFAALEALDIVWKMRDERQESSLHNDRVAVERARPSYRRVAHLGLEVGLIAAAAWAHEWWVVGIVAVWALIDTVGLWDKLGGRRAVQRESATHQGDDAVTHAARGRQGST